MMFAKSKTVAFTLAEILITLGIIGVVSAMTIPNLITKHQKQVTVQKLKSTYSILHQAIRLSIAENGDIGGWNCTDLTGTEKFNQYILPYIKATTEEISASDRQHMIYYQSSGSRETGLNVMHRAVEEITLLNGVELFITNDDTLKSSEQACKFGMMVDIDGHNGGKNQFGHDAFIISINPALYAYISYTNDGENATDISRTREELKDGPSGYNYQCNKSGRGMWCGALIQKDNWQIRDDYPW